jgi:hypothetical protein
MSDYNLALKVPMAMIERLDALVPDVTGEYRHLQATGLIRKVSRSTVARLAMDTGLSAMEERYRDAQPANHEPIEAIPAPRKVTAEPDDTDPASA